MANAKDSGATRAIPTAGPDFEHLLAQEVVIEAGDAAPTGAQAVAPDHSPRARRPVDSAADALPKPGLARRRRRLQREVEQFLYRQAELLDGKHWQAFIDLFADDGVYWMPVTPRADRMGRLAVDLRRGQADDGDPEGPRLASERVVAGADVGDQSPRQPRRDRVGRRRRRSRCARAST